MAVRVAAPVGVTTNLAEMELVAKALPEALRETLLVVAAQLVVVVVLLQQVATGRVSLRLVVAALVGICLRFLAASVARLVIFQAAVAARVQAAP